MYVEKLLLDICLVDILILIVQNPRLKSVNARTLLLSYL